MAGAWGDNTANNLLKLLLLGTAIANIADNAASSPVTVIAVGLHTASPAGALQNTNEIAYTSYTRLSRTRDNNATTGWNISTNTAALQALSSFAAGTGGSGTATHFSLGKTVGTGATDMYLWGTVTPNIVCGSGVTPQITTAVLLTLGIT
jgi:hypothetical protein